MDTNATNSTNSTLSLNVPAEPPAPAQDGPRFTAEDIQKARVEEKDKVYGRLNEVAEQNKALQAQVQALLDEQNARKEAEDSARREAEEAARKAAEAEMSAAELLKQKEAELQARINESQSEWENRFQQLQQEREQERATLEKEREFATLQAYTQQRIAAEQESIAPELLDFVGGNTQAEIDASIDRVKEKSAALVASLQETIQQQRVQQRGVSPTAGTSGPLEMFNNAQRNYSPEDIKNMSMAEYAKFREQAGVAKNGSGGLYS